MFNKKSGNIIILILFIVLIGMSIYVYRGKVAEGVTTKQAIMVKNNAKTEVETWNEKVTKL